MSGFIYFWVRDIYTSECEKAKESSYVEGEGPAEEKGTVAEDGF